MAPCKWFSTSEVYFFKIASRASIFDSDGGVFWRGRNARDEMKLKTLCGKSKIENILKKYSFDTYLVSIIDSHSSALT